MIDQVPPSNSGGAGQEALALTVGCTFGLDSVQPATAIMQVAPCAQPGVSIRSERWDTSADHHGYVDQYGNRCERFELATGASQITYEAQLVLTRPADAIEPDAPEVPVALLPHEVLNFVMPSRFCLPDELGHEAWQRFGNLVPGWARVQTIVDYVHGHLEFVPGASNPWTTAADAYRAGQGVCRDFAHLAITFCRALNIPARYVFGYIPDIGVRHARRADGLRSVVRGLPRRPLAHVRRAKQHAPHRARRRRPRPGRDRRRADHLVRTTHADRLRGSRRTQRRRTSRWTQGAAASSIPKQKHQPPHDGRTWPLPAGTIVSPKSNPTGVTTVNIAQRTPPAHTSRLRVGITASVMALGLALVPAAAHPTAAVASTTTSAGARSQLASSSGPSDPGTTATGRWVCSARRCHWQPTRGNGSAWR